MVNNFSKYSEEMFQIHIDEKNEIEDNLKDEHVSNIETLNKQHADECMEDKKNILKTLNVKFSEETKKIITTLNEICYKSMADDKVKITN